jgi:hypothetical protein
MHMFVTFHTYYLAGLQVLIKQVLRESRIYNTSRSPAPFIYLLFWNKRQNPLQGGTRTERGRAPGTARYFQAHSKWWQGFILFLKSTPDSIDNMVGWQCSLVQEDLTWPDCAFTYSSVGFNPGPLWYLITAVWLSHHPRGTGEHFRV